MMRLIVNADDFGINEVVTSEIERMILARHISSTTIMANGKCLEEVKRFALEHPSVSYGVHLCLSEFDSLTKSDGLYKARLTDEAGVFITNAVFSLKSLADLEVKEAIKAELNAQLEVAKGLGIPLSHADSHHHVHALGVLSNLFVEVLAKHGIKKMRRAPDFHTFRAKIHLLQWIRSNQLNHYYSSHFIQTDDFYSVGRYFENGCPLKEGSVIELMCHPGHPGPYYRQEMQFVESAAISNLPNVQLISYNELV